MRKTSAIRYGSFWLAAAVCLACEGGGGDGPPDKGEPCGSSDPCSAAMAATEALVCCDGTCRTLVDCCTNVDPTLNECTNDISGVWNERYNCADSNLSCVDQDVCSTIELVADISEPNVFASADGDRNGTLVGNEFRWEGDFDPPGGAPYKEVGVWTIDLDNDTHRGESCYTDTVATLNVDGTFSCDPGGFAGTCKESGAIGETPDGPYNGPGDCVPGEATPTCSF